MPSAFEAGAPSIDSRDEEGDLRILAPGLALFARQQTRLHAAAMQADRRRSPRRLVCAEVEFCLRGEDGRTFEPARGVVRDISASGLALYHGRALSARRLRLSFLADPGEGFELSIAYSRRCGMYWLTGARFSTPLDPDRFERLLLLCSGHDVGWSP